MSDFPAFERPELILRVDEIGWMIFDKPDLECAVDPQAERLCRGAGPRACALIVRKARKASFVGTGWLATSRDDLAAPRSFVSALGQMARPWM